ncbi:Appr-1-p processing protein [Flexivirga caeni]|uniref:Appr-1-p processing protein n=1 Tax=Flexivirga caeni TaxID=2294115 RepID=A0A3M9MH09_9MICO|nr:Appr-1-p processing protein [Flexivirga caeni]
MPARRCAPPPERVPGAVKLSKISGDLAQVDDVDALVNPWNRNYMPRWLLFPGGVSRALKRRTGPGPWKQLAGAGVLPVGGCVVTDAGQLSGQIKLIHVAGLNLAWRATEATVHASVHGVIRAAVDHRMRHIAMPLIGSGSGGLDRASSLHCIEEALGHYTHGHPIDVLVVEHADAVDRL